MGALVQVTPGKFAVVLGGKGPEFLVQELDTYEQAQELLFRVLQSLGPSWNARQHIMLMGPGPSREVLVSRTKRNMEAPPAMPILKRAPPGLASDDDHSYQRTIAEANHEALRDLGWTVTPIVALDGGRFSFEATTPDGRWARRTFEPGGGMLVERDRALPAGGAAPAPPRRVQTHGPAPKKDRAMPKNTTKPQKSKRAPLTLELRNERKSADGHTKLWDGYAGPVALGPIVAKTHGQALKQLRAVAKKQIGL